MYVCAHSACTAGHKQINTCAGTVPLRGKHKSVNNTRVCQWNISIPSSCSLMHTHVHRCLWSLTGLKPFWYQCPGSGLFSHFLEFWVFPDYGCLLLTCWSTRSSLAAHSLMGRIFRNKFSKQIEGTAVIRDSSVLTSSQLTCHQSLFSPPYPWLFFHLPTLIRPLILPLNIAQEVLHILQSLLHQVVSLVFPRTPIQITQDNFVFLSVNKFWLNLFKISLQQWISV